jgi:DNA-directed RNA polymerase subunit RPC12/RpoP
MADGYPLIRCRRCGARLNVDEGMARVACGYCGTTMIVEQKASEVSIRAVVPMNSRRVGPAAAPFAFAAQQSSQSASVPQPGAGGGPARLFVMGGGAVIGLALLLTGAAVFSAADAIAFAVTALIALAFGYVLFRHGFGESD